MRCGEEVLAARTAGPRGCASVLARTQLDQPPCPSKKDFTADRQKGGTSRAW